MIGKSVRKCTRRKRKEVSYVIGFFFAIIVEHTYGFVRGDGGGVLKFTQNGDYTYRWTISFFRSVINSHRIFMWGISEWRLMMNEWRAYLAFWKMIIMIALIIPRERKGHSRILFCCCCRRQERHANHDEEACYNRILLKWATNSLTVWH